MSTREGDSIIHQEDSVEAIIETYRSTYDYLKRLYIFANHQCGNNTEDRSVPCYPQWRHTLEHEMEPNTREREWAASQKTGQRMDADFFKAYKADKIVDKSLIDRVAIAHLVQEMAYEAYAELLQAAKAKDYNKRLLILAKDFWTLKSRMKVVLQRYRYPERYWHQRRWGDLLGLPQ